MAGELEEQCEGVAGIGSAREGGEKEGSDRGRGWPFGFVGIQSRVVEV